MQRDKFIQSVLSPLGILQWGKAFSISPGILFRGSAAPRKSWYAEQPKQQLRRVDRSTSTSHLILLYTRVACSPALHCSSVAQKALDWVSSLVIFSCKAMGLHQHCPPATPTYMPSRVTVTSNKLKQTSARSSPWVFI